MTLLIDTLAEMKRPGLLVRTARLALQNFHRETVHRKLFGEIATCENTGLVLLEIEDALNTQRKTGDASYSIARHISALAALMYEAELRTT